MDSEFCGFSRLFELRGVEGPEESRERDCSSSVVAGSVAFITFEVAVGSTAKTSIGPSTELFPERS